MKHHNQKCVQQNTSDKRVVDGIEYVYVVDIMC